MASGPTSSWQTDGETMETVIHFVFWGSKISADGDCSHESKRHLLLRRKAMTHVGEVAQPCLTLCDPMDYSPPGSSVHGISQARILEWVAISFSRRSSQPRDWTWVSRIVGRRFTVSATREVCDQPRQCIKKQRQKRQRCKEQTFDSGRRWVWDDLRE